eukprot:GILK01002670.1.p1 GENE.GILK01002670.1~~GILK01002670.1.p1  ORF type:complete len:277 (+),score=36.97 GILK01002670.1:31-831(+)
MDDQRKYTDMIQYERQPSEADVPVVPATNNRMDSATTDKWRKAVATGDLATVKRIIDAIPSAVSDVDRDGLCALSKAAFFGHLPVVQLIVRRKANIEAKDKSELTPLMFASREGHVPVIEFLIQKHAQINAVDKFGCTALFHAANNGKTDAIRALVEKGVDIDGADMTGCTPLMAASMKGHYDAARCLVDLGANIGASDKNKKTAIDLAKTEQIRNMLEQVQSLLQPVKMERNMSIADYAPAQDQAPSAFNGVFCSCFSLRSFKFS